MVYHKGYWRKAENSASLSIPQIENWSSVKIWFWIEYDHKESELDQVKSNHEIHTNSHVAAARQRGDVFVARFLHFTSSVSFLYSNKYINKLINLTLVNVTIIFTHATYPWWTSLSLSGMTVTPYCCRCVLVLCLLLLQRLFSLAQRLSALLLC